jgi:hypothetical protein
MDVAGEQDDVVAELREAEAALSAEVRRLTFNPRLRALHGDLEDEMWGTGASRNTDDLNRELRAVYAEFDRLSARVSDLRAGRRVARTTPDTPEERGPYHTSFRVDL